MEMGFLKASSPISEPRQLRSLKNIHLFTHAKTHKESVKNLKA